MFGTQFDILSSLADHLPIYIICAFPLHTIKYYAEVEIRFLICQDKMSRQFEFWLDISRIWVDKFSGHIMIIIIMKGTKVLTFSASNLETCLNL